MFRKILVANRGEIALRIIRTCKKLGVKTISVYSDPDLESRHVTEADESYRLGHGEPSESYLNIPKILKVAKKSGAEAVHPGYGFFAENPHFAKECEENHVTFIGPTSKVLRQVANKLEAKRQVKEAGVPVIPGSTKEVTTVEEAESDSLRVGFPVLVKAVFGGGGRGIRIANGIRELRNAVERARTEAKTGFGRDEVYIEKYLERPRHIEVQVLADRRGKTVHLGERECSLQRRYQKILEESPSPGLTEGERTRLVKLALKIVRATRYENAGTLEFIRAKSREFYYMETNKRIQVEHLVTELVTGVDIVEEQLRIASGDGLALSQNEVNFSGSAVNCRVNAEDPAHNFTPTPGKVSRFSSPTGPGVRVDTALYDGCPVPEYYDSLIAKIACWGRDRGDAINRMRVALDETIVEGVKTTISVHQMIIQMREFLSGRYHTQLLDSLLTRWKPATRVDPWEAAAVYVALRQFMSLRGIAGPLEASDKGRWKAALTQDYPRRALFVEGM